MAYLGAAQPVVQASNALKLGGKLPEDFQEALKVGDNIQIDAGVISATDTTYKLADETTSGLVPALEDSTKVLNGENTWASKEEAGLKVYHGFVDRVSSLMTFASQDRVFTITPEGAFYAVYINGERVEASDSMDLQIPDTVGTHFLSFEHDGTISVSASPWNLLSKTSTLMASVHWDGTRGIIGEERHNYKRNLLEHKGQHDTWGSVYVSGFTPTPTFNNNNTFSFVGGVTRDEDNYFSFGPTVNTAIVGHKALGGNSLTFETSGSGFAKLNGGAPQWDDNGTLTNIATGKFGLYWVYATNFQPTHVNGIVSMVGQAEYNSADEAREATMPSLPSVGVAEWKLLYRVVVQNVAGAMVVDGVDPLYTTSTGPAVNGAGVSTVSAGLVTFVPSGEITAGNVQDAIVQAGSGVAVNTFAPGHRGLVPAAPSGAGTKKFLREDGDWEVPVDTTYEVFDSAKAGLVPKPPATSAGVLVLHADGLWKPLVEAGSIGIAGNRGFGVGVFPGQLPDGFKELDGTYSSASDNYGNYIYTDGSVLCCVPKFYYRIGSELSPHWDRYGLNSVDIAQASDFVDVAAANAAGFALPRAFIDGGEVKAAFFVDKYLCSPAGTTHGKSVKNGVPISLMAASAGLTTSGSMANCTGILADAVTLSRARGTGFACASVFIYAALGILQLAHAQASTASTYCAWYDASGVTNFPKGCNNNALGDRDDVSVLYVTAGDSGNAQKPKTGSAIPFAKTTHNGQDCGVADLNGCLYQVLLGVTNAGGSATANTTISSKDVYVLKESVKLSDLTADWQQGAGGNGAWGDATHLATLYDLEVGILPWAAEVGAWARWGNGVNQVLDGAVSGAGYKRTNLGVFKDPNSVGTGLSLFGMDEVYQSNRMNLFPRGAGPWSGPQSGVWYRIWTDYRSFTSYASGFRAAAYPN